MKIAIRTCRGCNTVFEYGDHDIRQSRSIINGFMSVKAWVVCPVCGNRAFIGMIGGKSRKHESKYMRNTIQDQVQTGYQGIRAGYM